MALVSRDIDAKPPQTEGFSTQFFGLKSELTGVHRTVANVCAELDTIKNLKEKADTPLPADLVGAVRSQLKETWNFDVAARGQDPPEGPARGADADLMAAFSEAVNDPDVELPVWMRRNDGAPFGADNPVEDSAGIFPKTDHQTMSEESVRYV